MRLIFFIAWACYSSPLNIDIKPILVSGAAFLLFLFGINKGHVLGFWGSYILCEFIFLIIFLQDKSKN